MPLQLLFTACIFLSAFLLFLVQPIIAKQVMPWFGGSSAVWTTALMFFQLLLLAGYAYSDAATRWLQARTHARLHMALLALAVASLPIIASDALRPDPQQAPIGQVLLLLLLTVGLPYFCLATTGPLLQAWYVRLFPQSRVYRLFALSNLASLAALLAYPFTIEPYADSPLQARSWSLGFGVFALLCASVAWASRRGAVMQPAAGPTTVPRQTTPAQDGPQPGWADIGLWLLLSALGSAWLLAVTNHLTQNIAAVPMLWLLPLSLYLLTFVLCFEGRGLYRHGWFAAPLILLLAAMAWGINIRVKDLHIAWAVPLYALGFFVCCMFCHGELSLRKPAPRHLTRFYLCLSLGGALGGLAVSALAPWALNHYYELPIVLMLTALLMLWLLRHYLTANKAAWGVLVLALASTALTGLMGWVFYQRQSVDNVVMMRNFYGASRVAEFTDQGRTTRALYNGAIVHGTQVLSGPGQGQPTTYYGQHSGVAVALQQLRQAAPGPRRVGVIGLGVGTLAAWGQAGDDWRFYELNPHSQQIAEQQFSYLRDTPARHSVVLGDARLVLESELAAGQPGRYDLLVVDAFSSDSIPVHLITREALALYRQHLAPGGIIAFHVSNLFLQLEPVVAGLARDAGLQAHHISSPAQGTETAADWVLVTDPAQGTPWPELASLSRPIPERPDLAVWTDGRNNLFKILR